MSSATARPSHQRTPSSTSVKPETKTNKKTTPEPAVHYTTLIRLPFQRNEFVDPAPVEWDAQKDRALWKIISRTSKTSDLDWEELANHFGVEAGFMLQQAAWLYERHLQHVRAQMRKIQPVTAGTASMSNVSSAGGYPMKRLGSGGSRAPSAMSVRAKDSPVPREGSGPSTPRIGAPPLSRTASTNTVTQSRLLQSPRQPSTTKAGAKSGTSAASKRPDALPEKVSSDDPNQLSPEPASSPASSSSGTSSSSSEEQEARPMRRSQLLKRPLRFGQKPKATLAKVLDEEGSDDDDDDDGALPFAARVQSTAESSGKKPLQPIPASTSGKPSITAKGKAPATAASGGPIESSASSASSFAPNRKGEKKPGPLSPHRRAELGRLNSGKKREGSEAGGTPSMGSSFSDLDDTSVTQSALEEALLSKMQHGAMSRMSNISNAFRSRYLG